MSSSILSTITRRIPRWSPSPSRGNPHHTATGAVILSGFSGDQPGAAAVRPHAAPLFRSSTESYTRPVRPVAERELEGASARTPVGARPGRQVLPWPPKERGRNPRGAPPFRLS